jgi:hypothetical protein
MPHVRTSGDAIGSSPSIFVSAEIGRTHQERAVWECPQAENALILWM